MKSKELSLFSRFTITDIEKNITIAHGVSFFDFKIVVYYSDTDSMAVYSNMDILYIIYPTDSKYKITFLDANIIPNKLFN